jgi:RimJ/RimL family protein N-acetyltransferase
MLPTVRHLSAAEVQAIEPMLTFPTVTEAGFDDAGKLIAMGGLSWRSDIGGRRCWMWYRLVDRDGDVQHPHLVVRTARRMLRKAAGQFGESQVYAWRDASEPGSQRLLEVLGFTFKGIEPVLMLDGTELDREVWTWQTPSPGPQSPPSAR